MVGATPRMPRSQCTSCRDEKLHFLNPVPIQLIHDRWINKFTERQASALVNLKSELEADT